MLLLELGCALRRRLLVCLLLDLPLLVLNGLGDEAQKLLGALRRVWETHQDDFWTFMPRSVAETGGPQDVSPKTLGPNDGWVGDQSQNR